MRILITGFEAFGGRDFNPTKNLIHRLEEGKLILPTRHTVMTAILPVTFREAYLVLEEKIKSFAPDMVIAFGLASKRTEISLERVAINCLDADILDNEGQKPVDQLINIKGETAYFSTLPIRKFEEALKAKRLPVHISNTAGTFVCNYIFYKLLESQKVEYAGFIHVPLPEYLREDQLLEAVSVILSEVE